MEPLKPKEIAILYTGAKENSPREDLLKTLPGKIYERSGVGAIWKKGNCLAGDPENQVTIQTIHASKGLQYRAVIILWAGTYHHSNARRLLYVGMTRAESFLAITASGWSQLVADIEDSPACTVIRESCVDGLLA